MAVPLLSLIPSVTSLLGGVMDMLSGDKKAQAEALLKELDYSARAQEAQIEVNKVEAGSQSLFVSGWRPCVGWICAVGLGYQFLLQPLLVWGCSIYSIPPPPALSDVLWELILGMLGLGGLRSIEKCKKKH